jgi:hypothetical protein
MQGIQPKQLSNNELLRYVYVMGFDKVPPDWIETLVERMAALIDRNENLFHEGFEDGFEDGFAQGIEHATDDFK